MFFAFVVFGFLFFVCSVFFWPYILCVVGLIRLAESQPQKWFPLIMSPRISEKRREKEKERDGASYLFKLLLVNTSDAHVHAVCEDHFKTKTPKVTLRRPHLDGLPKTWDPPSSDHFRLSSDHITIINEADKLMTSQDQHLPLTSTGAPASHGARRRISSISSPLRNGSSASAQRGPRICSNLLGPGLAELFALPTLDQDNCDPTRIPRFWTWIFKKIYGWEMLGK